MQYESPILEQKELYQTPQLVEISEMSGTNICLTAGFVSSGGGIKDNASAN